MKGAKIVGYRKLSVDVAEDNSPAKTVRRICRFPNTFQESALSCRVTKISILPFSNLVEQSKYRVASNACDGLERPTDVCLWHSSVVGALVRKEVFIELFL